VSIHTTTPPNIQKPNCDTDVSYPTTLPGVSSGTKPDQTPPNATHTHAGTQPRPAFPRPQPRQRRRPRASVTAAHPPNGHTINAGARRRPQRRMIPKTKQIKPRRKTRESTAQGRRSLVSQFPLLAAGSSTRRGAWPEIQPPGARRSAGCSRSRW
jgi:hypothetical protein